MEIQICSDLHLEFHHDRGRQLANEIYTDVDVLVLAGDIDICSNIHESLSYICGKYKNSQVVWVTGNHTYYHASKKQVDRATEQLVATNPNLHILENSATTIKRQRFIGCTLWFPNQANNIFHEQYLNDFYVIKNFRQWIYKKNQESIKYLSRQIKSSDVVVTHHVPTMSAIDKRYKNSNLNRFFVCPMDNTIQRKKPKLWCFGHTHSSFDAIYERTRLLCNPAGYPHEWNEKFNPHLVVEV